MALEIERKFLLKNEDWRLDENGQPRRGTLFRQGYLSRNPARVVRLRLEGDSGFITVKGRSSDATGRLAPGKALTRVEFQYSIPVADCAAMLDSLAEQPLIEKTRYLVNFGGLTWEIDEFHGQNAGLLVAEVELSSPDQTFPLPPWVGAEVSSDPRYANSSLVAHPFSRW